MNKDTIADVESLVRASYVENTTFLDSDDGARSLLKAVAAAARHLTGVAVSAG